MAAYEGIDVRGPDRFDRLEDSLDGVFQPKQIAKRLNAEVTKAVEFVLVEHGYVDKDYRSTFYGFYSKKGRSYRRDCVRLHFFSGSVTYDESRTNIVSQDGCPGDHYFGYIVLRPTMTATLGRSVLAPGIRVAAKGRAIQSEHRVNVLGHTFAVWGFPSMAQPADIAVCAHVSCWTILRYYSERFPQCREYLLYDMAQLASSFDPGGLIPSLGLSVWEAERVFQAAGCFPLVIAKRRKRDDDEAPVEDREFLEQLLAYLESGFPLFVEIGSRQHAVVAVGYSWRDQSSASLHDEAHTWEQVESLLMVDDNRLPYRSVPPTPTPESIATNSYTGAEFDSFIVVLPERVHFPADAVDALSIHLAVALKKGLGVEEGGVLMRRYFMTTISELRGHAREYESQMGNVLVRLLMEVDSPHYVWVIEFCSQNQWDHGHVTARAIVDASASKRDPVATVLLHDEQQAIVFDRSSGTQLHKKEQLRRATGVPLPRMEVNLGQVVRA
ncbi:MAG: hypothetical protein OXC12_18705 [Spirochaetaceae bacterium]|nr:hypothetical protein [Spirochaetaceae bacterium]